MRKALVVGIDYYSEGSPLFGCVQDANDVKALLDRHSDGTVNFGVKLVVSTGPSSAVNKQTLRKQIKELFQGDLQIRPLAKVVKIGYARKRANGTK